MFGSNEKLKKFFLEKNLISTKELEKAFLISQKTNTRLDRVLLQKGIVLESEFLAALADFYDFIFMSKLEVFNIDDLNNTLSFTFLERYKMAPFYKDKECIKVAINDPLLIHPLDELRLILSNYDVVPVLSPESEIIRVLHRYYDSGTSKEETEDDNFLLGDLDESRSSIDLANTAPIIKMVNVILSNAINEKSSDIHIEPQERELWVRYRIDGILKKVLSPPKSIQSGIISRIKIMGSMNIAENRLPQDGRINIRVGGKDIDIRVSSLPSQYGERIVMRLLNKTDSHFSLENIGFSKQLYAKYINVIQKPHGIILITGPTGSGKTSTLYASLSHIKSEAINIITVEDPIEYQIDAISQVQAKPQIGLTFAEGLRTILRQDPDVIMVGEIRDQETAKVASQSALTGHLVFSTLHTNDAPSAVTRLIDMGVEPYLVASTCIAFMAQRLVRVLCDCKTTTTITKDQLEKLGFTNFAKNKKIYKVFQQKGCKECNLLGYKGRQGVYEFFEVDEEVRNLILTEPNLDALRRVTKKKGMRALRDTALQSVVDGVTSLEEALRVT